MDAPPAVENEVVAKRRASIRSLRLDPFLVTLLATVAVASVLPARGGWAIAASDASVAAIALLFFLQGARLSTEAVIAGMRAWPIHVTVILATFVMFPVFGLILRRITGGWLNPMIGNGILLLCLMPSTVQSSVAFTSIAGGNVPAAVASASASNMLGVMLTPLLAMLLLGGKSGGVSLWGIYNIALQLLLPFIVGHLARPLLRAFLERHRALTIVVDRGAILSVVYVAFSAAVVEGLWQRYALGDLAWTFGLDLIVLALALATTTVVARLFRFRKNDEIPIVFCGSKKSLVSGVPIASAIFPTAQVGPLILPLMIFHQLQLMACAVLAQRYATRNRTV